MPIYSITTYIVVPLVLLIALRIATKFPLTMVLLVIFVGPLLGVWVLTAVAELSKTTPNISVVLVAWIIYYIYAVPIYGFWVANFAVVGWWCLRHVMLLKPVRERGGAWIAVLGALVGPVLNFALLMITSLDPNWPTGDTIGRVLSDRLGIFSYTLQGALAGAVCAAIVARYLKSAGGTYTSEATRAPTGGELPPQGTAAAT